MLEKNIPLPGPSKYPFATMEVGDSFAVKGDEAFKARASAYQYGRRFNQKYSVRKNGVGYRIWRTA